LDKCIPKHNILQPHVTRVVRRILETDEQHSLNGLAKKPLGFAWGNCCKGEHLCPFCNKAEGDGELILRGQDMKWYVSPVLILHYIEAHGYVPPAIWQEQLLHIGQEQKWLPTPPVMEV